MSCTCRSWLETGAPELVEQFALSNNLPNFSHLGEVIYIGLGVHGYGFKYGFDTVIYVKS